MILGQLRMGARQAKNAPLVFDTLNRTWSFSYSALHLEVSIHCTLVVWRNYRALPPAATGGCSTSQFQLSNFLPRNCKVQYFRPDHDAWISFKPEVMFVAVEPKLIVIQYQGAHPRGNLGNGKTSVQFQTPWEPWSSSQLIGGIRPKFQHMMNQSKSWFILSNAHSWFTL